MSTTDTHDTTGNIDLTKDAGDAAVAGDSPPERAPRAGDAVDVVHDTTTPADVSPTNDYVVPIVHAHIPEVIMHAGSWAALGTVAVVGAVDLPAVGVLAAGLFVIRRRHQR